MRMSISAISLLILLSRFPCLFMFSDNDYIITGEISTNNAKIILNKELLEKLASDGSCEANTFVDFDCNSCFCSSTGSIDPKWCTYDDCEAKRAVINSNKIKQSIQRTNKDKCSPGSVTTIDCNFCICPETGNSRDMTCTKNSCTQLSAVPTISENLYCTPLEYYEVDCNICYCPQDGMKNLAKCTKKQCETRRTLRSQDCLPGKLFTDDCNICICPLNGEETEKACTDRKCDQTTPWREIFRLSEQLLGHKFPNNQRQLEVCFPGEEFTYGCNICTCPNQGLKQYAKCVPTLCEIEGDLLDNKDIRVCIKYDSNDCVNASHTFFND